MQAELERALEEATRCSESLEFLLKEARDEGGADLEMFKRITKANKQWEEAMERYTIIYSAYDNVRAR